MCYRLLGSLGDLVYSSQLCLPAKIISFFHKNCFAGFQTGKNTSMEKCFISFWILHSNIYSRAIWCEFGVDSTWSRRLDQMPSQGPFQSELFYESKGQKCCKQPGIPAPYLRICTQLDRKVLDSCLEISLNSCHIKVQASENISSLRK